MFWNAFKKNLDFGFTDYSQGVRVRLLEKPGTWMPQEQLDRIAKDLRQIVSESIPAGSLEYGVLTGSQEAFARSVLTIIYDSKTNEPLAFNALAYMPCSLRGRNIDVLHLGLVVVSPKRREGGFSWILYGLTTILLFLRNRLRPLWVSNVTQVPAIIGKVTESFNDVFPTPEKKDGCSFDHTMLARQIMQSHRHVFGVGSDADFDEKNFVIQNAYTGGSDHLKKTFTQAQHHRNPLYNQFCEQKLNYQRGDDFLQLGKMDLVVAKNYLLRSVPAESYLTLMATLLIVGFQSLLVPVLHWFDGRSHQGEVRPWKT